MYKFRSSLVNDIKSAEVGKPVKRFFLFSIPHNTNNIVGK